jgi:hypothetical protein
VALSGLFLASENAAQCSQIEQVALTGAYHQTHIGHDQHYEKLQEALGRTFVNAIANDEAEKVGPDDSEDASDDRADKPLQADASQAEFKQNYRDSEEHSNARCGPSVQPKRPKFVAGNCRNEYK